MKALHSPTKPILLIFSIGFILWAAVVIKLGLMVGYNIHEADWGLTKQKTIIFLASIILLFLILFVTARLIKGKLINPKVVWFSTPEWLKWINIVVILSSFFIHILIISMAYGIFVQSPPETGYFRSKFIIDAGSYFHLKRKTERTFIEGYAAIQGDGHFVILDSPFPIDSPYAQGNRLKAESKQEKRSWGNRIVSSGKALGTNPIKQKHRSVNATVFFPYFQGIDKPQIIKGVLELPAEYPVAKINGFVNEKRIIVSTPARILVGPVGTTKLMEPIYRKCRLIYYCLFLPTVIASAFFIPIFSLCLGIKPKVV